jgi:hypothetical protein
VLVPAGGSVVSRDGEDLDLSVVEMVAVEVVCWGDGAPIREFLYAGDAAEALLPLTVTCWPSISGADAYLNLEYECAAGFDVQHRRFNFDEFFGG